MAKMFPDTMTVDEEKRWKLGFWFIYLAAAASLTTTLALPYVGEEAVYTLISQEMHARGEFFLTTLYGTPYPRPPFLNWLMIPVADALGWDRVLLASRIITAAATAATGLVLAWLALNLTRNQVFAALAAALYLSGDVLFYRGWLAYADSLFTLCVFGSIACLWVAVSQNRAALLWAGVAVLTCGFLTKVQTAYLFYAVALLVLATCRDYRSVLLKPLSVFAHAAAGAAFVAWNVWVVSGAYVSSAAIDIIGKLQTADWGAYWVQLGWFPLETFLRFLPASAVAVWLWHRARRGGAATADAALAGFPIGTLVSVTALNYLPYWVGPQTHIRYIMPIYPLIALLIAWVIWVYGRGRLGVVAVWLATAVALKYALGLWAFPVYQAKYRGDYPATARQIIERTRGFPLYTTDVSATGLSVAASINTLRAAQPPVMWPPAEWSDAFVLSYRENPQLGRAADRYTLGQNHLHLLCRGAACRQPRH